jgi:GTP cyclohydrolase I
MNRQAAQEAIEAFLRALGHEPSGPLADTGRLVAAAWCDELLDGYTVDAAATLREASLAIDEAGGEAGGGLVALRDLSVTMICPHHLLVSHGRGDVFYLPGKELVGLGGIARALAACTRRLTLQEQAGERMAKLLCDAVGARGAACRLRLTHTCLLARGARESGAVLETLSMQGAFGVPGPERDLALAALGARE